MVDNAPQLQRRIRSFVKREGRLTRAQQRALDELLPRYGIRLADGKLDLDELFGRRARRVLEIGFGNGMALAELAEQNPATDYLGIEVHRPGVGHLLQEIEKRGLANVRLSTDDAMEVLAQQIPANALDAVYLFFPDPWHKKRHHKRRIVQAEFADLIRSRLKAGGILHMATDWQDYAEHMLAIMEAAEGFMNVSGPGRYTPRPAYRPLTKFEQRGKRLGHGVWDLQYRKREPAVDR